MRNTPRNQSNSNELITTYLKKSGFNPVVKDGVVTVGAIQIETMKEALKLKNHQSNSI